MSYHSELARELEEENRSLRTRLERYGGEDSEDIYTHKGVCYLSLNQVEIPAEVLARVIYGINRSAEAKVIKAVEAALTTEQRLYLDKLEGLTEATIEQPAGETVPLDMVALAHDVSRIGGGHEPTLS